MTQYFYKFRDTSPLSSGMNVGNFSDAPSGMKRMQPLDTARYFQELSRIGDNSGGLDIWQKNPDGGASTNNFSLGYAFGPSAQATNVECLVKIVGIHYNGGNFNNDGPGLIARVDPNSLNYYELQTGGSITGTGSGISYIRKRVDGSTINLTQGTAGIAKTTPVWYRFQLTGTTLRIKSWLDSVSEPAAWGHTVTDTSITAAGNFYFGFCGGSGTGYGTSAGVRYRLFQLSFGTEGDPAPLSLNRAVSGTLLKPDGSAAAGYLVRCYSRLTGEKVGETLSNAAGAFAFALNSTEKVYCVAVDQLGNQWNAPIKDMITPLV